MGVGVVSLGVKGWGKRLRVLVLGLGVWGGGFRVQGFRFRSSDPECQCSEVRCFDRVWPIPDLNRGDAENRYTRFYSVVEATRI